MWCCNYCLSFPSSPVYLLTSPAPQLAVSASGPRYGPLQMFAWPHIFKQEDGAIWRIFKLNWIMPYIRKRSPLAFFVLSFLMYQEKLLIQNGSMCQNKISPRDVTYSMVIVLNNTILYI